MVAHPTLDVEGGRIPVPVPVAHFDKVGANIAYTAGWGDGRNHKGIDIGMPEGTPLTMLTNGVVTSKGFEAGYGNYVVYEMPDGQEIIYAHLSAYPGYVEVGKQLKAGDIVGFAGDTGRSTGAHLHLGLYAQSGVESSLIDPVPFLQNLARNQQLPVPRSNTNYRASSGGIPTQQGTVRSASLANPANGDVLPSSYPQSAPLALAIPPDHAPPVKPSNNYGYKAIDTDKAFRNKLHSVSQYLGTHPQWLADVMAVESYDTFRHDAQGSDSALGLIGFMPATAAELGTTQSALMRMSRVEQMDYVQKFLEPFKGRLNSVFDIAVAVYRPAYFDRWKRGDTNWEDYNYLEQTYFPMLGRGVGRRYANERAANVTHTRYVAGCSICAQSAYGGFIVPHEAQYG